MDSNAKTIQIFCQKIYIFYTWFRDINRKGILRYISIYYHILFQTLSVRIKIYHTLGATITCLRPEYVKVFFAYGLLGIKLLDN